MHINTKAARFWQLAFSIIILSTFIGCQDPGTLGGGFIDKTDIDIDTLLVTNLTSSNQDAYLGRLGRSAIGSFDDGLFGEIESVSFFKPSIFRPADTVVFDANTIFKLQLQLQEGEVYGDTTQTGTYSIYRVNSLWRGSAFRNSMSISFDEAETIGQFSDADADTSGVVEVELSGSWKDDYIPFFNEPDSTRDDIYKRNDFGLVIVQDAGINKIIYANYSLSNIQAIAEDTTSHFILDWGYDLDRTGATVDPERIMLQTTFNNILRLDLSALADEVSDINFVRAELVFSRDTLNLSNTLQQDEVRSPSLGLGLSIGPLDDVAYEVAFGSIDLSAAARDDGTYRYNITNILNSYIHGELTINDLYLYLSANQGTLAYTSLYNAGADPELAPRVILYGLESGVR
ncbi:MAG: hypothetical protein JJ971_04925 [Balneolaceae bacterium]|nr:hypothetical protein [Balneolaceae bacterium]MBO6545720.1 hypothetical protein [Balneolaceae bacterium]MBO6647116.1 hypothetical protein [Balneolaceae bacterium]